VAYSTDKMRHGTSIQMMVEALNLSCNEVSVVPDFQHLGHRRELLWLFGDPDIATDLIQHKSRLGRAVDSTILT